ncbi:hypothetical protein PVAND_015701 [Polypedilum vanderplanki]|uniref:Ig-like domain-containing protein n=1 Tax=Polypedilum vanderplanki TaxID=319348 RepID=A0A9J6BDE6_POLVA|nr:hypothetical protein PVAND_015701 [Polypedilum vanderplanki]
MQLICSIALLVPMLVNAAPSNNEKDMKGPVFTNEPLNKVDFSNSTGAVVECRASGLPPPEIIWVRSDGTAVGDVPGLRQVLPNGNLVFPPFRAEDYRQEVHAQVYACLAKNQVGSIISRDVHVRAVAAQNYDTDINTEYVIRGNAAILKCVLPSYLSDYLTIISWKIDDEELKYDDKNYVANQFYDAEVLSEYIIKGNAAIIKCNIPSFVTDFVKVEAWIGSENNEIFTYQSPNETNYVVNQIYTPGLMDNEYVMRGNAAIIKCSIPSFVADFVVVEAWIDSDGNEIKMTNDFDQIINQYYDPGLMASEFVMKGNSAVLKCTIPSFVADFVYVTDWIDDEGNEYKATSDYSEIVNQLYIPGIMDNEFVMRGNAAIIKCSIPSFVADFVQVEAWIDSDGNEIKMKNDFDQIINQYYDPGLMPNEFVMKGNAAIIKCTIPSFVADFVYVTGWIDDEGNEYHATNNYSEIVNQIYTPGLIDNEYIMRGNAAILKCLIPSFVADFVQVETWIDSDGNEIKMTNDFDQIVNQHYDPAILPTEYVMRGNSAILRCSIPSFVADFVYVTAWIDDEGIEILPTNDFGSIVNQIYDPEILGKEYVMRGNSAILKCTIPSFVADFVSVTAWIDDEGQEFFISENGEFDQVVNQFYDAEITKEYVMRGNAAILKCLIPSFVADFVHVTAWVDDEGTEYVVDNDWNNVVHQHYDPGLVDKEYVMRGNAAIIKCLIPSFVADFVHVEAWVDEDENEYKINNNEINSKVINQVYNAEITPNEYVMRGNSAIIKCLIPSFVADFVHVIAWINEEGNEYKIENSFNNAVIQYYEIEADNEYVIRGNAAIMKCKIPSYISDFITVDMWQDTDNATYYSNSTEVVSQSFEIRVIDEFILVGNAAIMRCLLPSFIADFIQVVSWVVIDGDDNNEIPLSIEGSYVVNQYFEIQVYDVFVMRGNTAIFKCQIPSFVSDHLDITEWVSTENDTYQMGNEEIVVSHPYSVNVMDEHVLKGNSAILKCHIPSFVSDFVNIDAWIDEETGDEFLPDNIGEHHLDGKYLVLPSGELHIRDVGPEDGYKSYQCRTKHRLTGETRLSATKGRLVITEPVGSTQPILTFGSDQKHISGVENSDITILTCAVQSFPAASIRPRVNTADRLSSNIGELGSSICLTFNAQASPKPVGSTQPILTFGSEPKHIIGIESTDITVLTCAAQAFPQASQRLIFKIESKLFKSVLPVSATAPKLSTVDIRPMIIPIGQSYSLLCPFQGWPSLSQSIFMTILVAPKITTGENIQVVRVSRNENLSLLCISQSKPVSATAPKLATVDARPILIPQKQAFSLLCPAQEPVSATAPKLSTVDTRPISIPSGEALSLLCPFQEPVNLRPPVFNTESKTSHFEKPMGTNIALLAQVQAFPLPIPVGSVPPKITGTRLQELEVRQNQSFSMVTLAQSWPVPSQKPVGSRAPTFANDVKSISISREIDQPFELSCRAQEPVGTVPPKVTGDRLQELEVNHNKSLSILCLGQSAPAPQFSSRPPVFNSESISTHYKKPMESNIALMCAAQGAPTPLVFRWYKFIDGSQRKSPVPLGDRIKQVSGTLIIKNAVVEDSGKYLCVVNNSVGGESVETVLTVTAPLSAEIEPKVQTIDFGRPAVFTCRFSGNPVKTMRWMKDGKFIDHTEAVLTIPSIKKEDKGMYQCIIKNDQESAQATAELKLGGRFDPPIIRQAFSEEILHPGTPVFIKCIAGGNPTPEISWELDGKKISNSERFQVGQYVTVNGDVVSFLNITSAQTKDGGLMKCIASSKVGTVEHKARLNIHGMPYVKPMEKKSIVSGETLVVNCPVAGYPIESIVWERENRVLPINRKQKVFPNGTLIIENVERNSDQATYTCVAKATDGYSARGTLEVEIMVLPQIVPFDFGADEVNLDEMVSATCTVNKGDFPIDIQWIHTDSNGIERKLLTSDGIVITRTNQRISMLSIESCQRRHIGNFSCVASNKAGKSSHSAYLSINGSI